MPLTDVFEQTSVSSCDFCQTTTKIHVGCWQFGDLIYIVLFMLRGTKAFRNIEAVVHITFFLSEKKQKITVEKEKRCILNENIDSWFEGKCLSYKLPVSPSTLFVCLFVFLKILFQILSLISKLFFEWLLLADCQVMIIRQKPCETGW